MLTGVTSNGGPILLAAVVKSVKSRDPKSFWILETFGNNKFSEI